MSATAPSRRARAASLLAAGLLATALPAAAASVPPTEARTPVTRADQLPRRSYALPAPPSALLAAPLAELRPLANQLGRDIESDLAAYDIRDAATLRTLENTRLNLALLRGDWGAVPALAARQRALHEKPGPRQAAALLPELLAALKVEGAAGADLGPRLRAQVAARYGALPWVEVQDVVTALKGQLEMASPALVVGSVRSQLDPAARNADGRLDAASLALLLGARAQIEHLLPHRDEVVAALAEVVARHRQAGVSRPDRWRERLVTLAPDTPAQPVTVAIWDSGVDMRLFAPAAARGLAFDAEGLPSDELLRPLGPAASRWPELRSLLKGAFDLRAALDNDDTRRLKARLGALQPEQVERFQEDLAAAGLYVHGTHVAGIAVAGNPFARVLPVSMHWSHRAAPQRPDEARSLRVAQNYRRIVAALQQAGVRVVNMSWRYGPGATEAALAYHGVGRDAEERKAIARRLFAIERDALRDAIASAPGILFVAGAGNEDNDAGFVEYVPAGLELPNLVTVGAVDAAGDETTFSTFGRTVAVHANGFEVESPVPGGEPMKLSGTSMAAPQVTNLAAKLLALHPSLTPAELKTLILAGADERGRVRWIHPRATLALAHARAAASASR